MRINHPMQAVDGFTVHELFPVFLESGMPLYRLRALLGGAPSEQILSKMLRGISAMPGDIEKRIRAVLSWH